MATCINTLLHPTSNSGIFGCGRNLFDQFLDSGEKTQLFNIPISGINSFSCGAFHSIYLTNDQKLISAGQNSDGQCGQGDFSSPVSSGFILASGSIFSGAAAVSCGRTHTAILDIHNNVYVCGDSANGGLGLGGGATDKSSLVPTLSGGNILKILASDQFTLALRDDGKVDGVGENDDGQLGVGDAINKTSWVLLGGGDGISDVVDIGVGRDQSFVIKNNGAAWAAGFNGNGQLGIATVTASETSFVQVSGISNISKITGGQNHTLFLLEDGTLWSCGDNGAGQLGIGVVGGPTKSTPLRVSGLSNNIIDIGAGQNISYALTSDGILYAWGNNANGAIGQGTSIGNIDIPTIMISGSGFDIVELYSDAEQMTSLASGYKNKSPNLFISGPLGIEDEVNLYTCGFDSINDNINLCASGIGFSSGFLDLFISQNLISQEIEFFIKGLPSGDFNIFVRGHTNVNDNLNLFISGIPWSDSDLFIHGFDVASGDFNLYIDGGGFWSAYVDVVQNNPVDNISLFIYGSQSGIELGYTTNEFPLFINNDSSTPFIDIFISAFAKITSDTLITENSENWSVFVKGGNVVNDNINVFIKGHASGDSPFGIDYSESFNLSIKGLGSADSEDFIPTTQIFDAFIKTNSGAIDQLPLFMSGFIFPVDDLTLFVFGISGAINGNANLFINGYNDIGKSLNLNILGIFGSWFDNIDLYLDSVNVGEFDNNSILYVHGF